MLIESNALDLGAPGWDEFFGSGLIQMDSAIQQAMPTATPQPTTTVQGDFPTNRMDEFLHGVTFTPALPPNSAQTLSLTPTASQAPYSFVSETPRPGFGNTTTITSLAQVHATEETGGNDWLGCAGVSVSVYGREVPIDT